jgi:adenosylhomocysteine nucleosidase
MQKAEGKRQKAAGTLVCFPLREEAAPFGRVAAGLPGVAVLMTGMGKRNAERTLREWLERWRPAQVISCGFAGGLDPELTAGTIVFAAPAGSPLTTALSQVGARPVRFHCADRIVATAEEKRALRERIGADAVEMESQAMEAVCQDAGIPFATVRVILDTAAEDLPLDFNRLLTPDLRMHYGRLAGALLKAPGKIPALLALQRQTKAAAAKLADVLVTILA